MPIANPTADQLSSDLCRDCGLCCNGSIFDSVKLEDDEVRSAATLGLDPEVGPNGARFALPCRRFHAVCQIYLDRPLRCRDYRCALLVRLDDGDVDFGTAQAIVVEARRLLNEADRVSRAGEDRATSRRRWADAFATMPGGKEEASTRNHDDPRWLLAMTALNYFLDRHFRWPYQRRLSGDMDSPEIPAKDQRAPD